MKKIITWFKESKHLQNLWMFFLIALANMVVLKVMQIPTDGCIVASLFTFIVGAVCLEDKDEENGGIFLWDNILAGLIGTVLGICMVLLCIILI